MSTYMGSTEVPVEKSVDEIRHVLRRARICSAINERLDTDGRITSINFTLTRGAQSIPVQLPARCEALYMALLADRKRPPDLETKKRLRAQAERIAWRQILRWVQAQVALIETEMVEACEVFLPYVLLGHDRTFYKAATAGGQLLLTAPEAKS